MSGKTLRMGDLIFIAIVIGFFAVTVLFVKACDSIIGPDPDPASRNDSSRVVIPAIVKDEVPIGGSR